jgi:hypothetical protein
MDATFGTNDVKYHVFTLMGFDVHHIRMPLTWTTTNQQTMNDLIEWLQPLKTKISSIMLNWRPICFIINDTLQELWTLRWIWILPYFFLHNYAQWKSKVFLVQGFFHSYEAYNVLTYLAIVKIWCDLCVNALFGL